MCKSVAYEQKLINESCNCIVLTSAYSWKHSNFHDFSCARSLLHFADIWRLAFFKRRRTCSVLPT